MLHAATCAPLALAPGRISILVRMSDVGPGDSDDGDPFMFRPVTAQDAHRRRYRVPELTTTEKHQVHAGLRRFGRHDVGGIARGVPTKNVVQVANYIAAMGAVANGTGEDDDADEDFRLVERDRPAAIPFGLSSDDEEMDEEVVDDDDDDEIVIESDSDASDIVAVPAAAADLPESYARLIRLPGDARVTLRAPVYATLRAWITHVVRNIVAYASLRDKPVVDYADVVRVLRDLNFTTDWNLMSDDESAPEPPAKRRRRRRRRTVF